MLDSRCARGCCGANREGNAMPKYLISGSFSAEGLQRLQKEGRTPMFVDKASGRGQAFSEAVQALGGKVEALYFSLGRTMCT